jgi:hypothetical protein
MGMGSRAGIVTSLVAVAMLLLVAAGCGSDSASSDSGEGNKTFIVAGGKNTLAKFGQEADDSEREEVAEIVEESLDAREDHDWAGQCATLSKGMIKTAEESPGAIGATGGCKSALETEGDRAPASVLKNNVEGSVVAFRVKGNAGYALYHGTDKKDWAMPMEKEGDEWKVGALVAKEIPSS